MVVIERKEAESTERDLGSLFLTNNSLRIAIYSISYIRGVFPEDYFDDHSFVALEMNIKKLIPMDLVSGRLIDFLEKGVCDALHKKYLKNLVFCICENEEGPMIDEYAFTFSYPNTDTEEVVMNMSRTGNKNSSTFKSNAAEVTPDQMRSSACKMIRTIISLMRNVDPLPEEIMKAPYDDNTNSADDGMDSDENGIYSQSSDKKSGYILVSASKKIKFLLGSGATHHICNDESIMKSLKEIKKEHQVPLYSVGGRKLKAKRTGSVVYKDFKLSQVGLIPSMPFNVVSVGQLASQGLLTNIGDGRFMITSPDEAKLVGEGFLQRRKEKGDDRVYNEYVFRSMNWEMPGDDEKLADTDEHHNNRSARIGQEWIINTGCARHMVLDRALLKNAKPEELPFQTASGSLWSTHEGAVKIGDWELRMFCLVHGPQIT